ncbi:MAG TPA: molybdate ABC transporter permease subunit [Acidimicrobiales bacterium]|nr:molybdate ABC transporter permease subunit [Acidimicrobiales bacterium]
MPRTPVGLVAAAGIGVVVLGVPVLGLLARTPWSDAGRILRADATLDALRISLAAATLAAGLAVALGVPLAWVLARTTVPGRAVLRALALLPLVLPPVVGGVALLAAFGRRGLLGGALDLPFSFRGVVAAELFVALPFVVVTVEAGLRQLDTRYEEAAALLGAGPWTVFRTVTLPLTLPAVGAGAALAWARALGEFGATVTFAGTLPGRTETLPSAVYVALEAEPGAALVLSVLLLAIAVAVLFALRGRWLGAWR